VQQQQQQQQEHSLRLIIWQQPAMNLRNARLVLAFLLLMVAEPFIGPHSSSFIRVASGQGLSVSADNLGAGAEATANEFEQFESALELATTGGRGRYVAACTCCSCCRRNRPSAHSCGACRSLRSSATAVADCEFTTHCSLSSAAGVEEAAATILAVFSTQSRLPPCRQQYTT
jgi:hypothetical protein